MAGFVSGHWAAQLATDARFRTASDRKVNEDELEWLLTAWTVQHDKWEVTRDLQAAGVAAFPSMNSKDLTDDPHLMRVAFLPDCHIRKSACVPTPVSPGS